MTPSDYARIAIGTACLALALHPLIASTTETRDNVDCQIVSLGNTSEGSLPATFTCGGAEVSMADTLAHMGIVHVAKKWRASVTLKTRWLRCRLTEVSRPIAFGFMPQYVRRDISACKPLIVSPTPRRWVCYMAPRGTCLT